MRKKIPKLLEHKEAKKMCDVCFCVIHDRETRKYPVLLLIREQAVPFPRQNWRIDYSFRRQNSSDV